MRTLELDELENCAGGIHLGAINQQLAGGVAGSPVFSPTYTTQPQLLPLTGLTPFGQPTLSPFGGAGGLGDLGGIVNQLVHSPAVSGIIGSISQANPQIGGVIQSALGALQNGNIAGMIPQLASTIGQLTGHPEIGSLATQFLGALGPQLGGQPTLGGFPPPVLGGFPPAGFAQPGLGVQPGLGIQPGLSPLTNPLGHF